MVSSEDVKLIDAELYRKILKSEMFQLDDEHRLDIQRAIILLDQTPATDLESLRPKGKWVGEGMDVRCNQCGEHPLKDMDGDFVWYWSYKPMFCPNCGAKMEGDNV